MTAFKQIHNKFWQNDFVLGLTAEERYFYIYLITNSMTTQCGIYKLNRKLAELEIGYTDDKIEKCLEKFEEYGKVVVSKTTTEIMLVNWLKHNLKSSKKALELINKELRDVKDKELLERLYDYCSRRHCPIKELFSGVIIPEAESKKDEHEVKDSAEAAQKMQEETDFTAPKEKNIDSSLILNRNILSKESTEHSTTIISNITKGGGLLKTKIDKGNKAEDVFVFESDVEEDIEEIGGGAPITSWGFAGDSAVAATAECSVYDGIFAVNTA